MKEEPPPHYTTAAPSKPRFDFRILSAWILVLVAVIVALIGAYLWGASNASITKVEILIPTASPVIVQVEGEVRAPGIYQLNAQDRVMTAIEAAGGVTENADLKGINIASLITDGERVNIPAIGPTMSPIPDIAESYETEVPTQSPSQVPDSSSSDEAINLNTATQEQLETLPGIGETRAAQIIAMRTQLGRFTSLEQLLEIRGIGTKTVEAIRPLVVIR